MSDSVLTQITGIAFFVTVMVIIITIASELSKRARIKRKKESEERLRRIREEEKDTKRRRKERLATLFSNIENRVSQELQGTESTNRIVSLPNGQLSPAPGKDIQEFLRMITIELSRKRTEYLIVGLLDGKNSPLYMLELKGRSVWVNFDIERILDKAMEVGAASIVCIHNHPTFSGSGPDLEPSEKDVSSGYSFYARCNRRGLNFLGDFIVSKGDYEEFLMPLIREVQNNTTDVVVEKTEKKHKKERKRELQAMKNTPVFLVDEIPLSFIVESKSLQGKGYCEKWTLLGIAEYVEEDIESVCSLIAQGRTPITKRVGHRGKYVWLARKKDFDTWIHKYKASHEN